ncbi:hypothetical protein LTR53_003502 [Teratosphaeriaceae sp. CCFEE 6253]|nr:hypothetical protein LTR53_003502 [Teratosphaeriaceae sp. CCFEE 6253]
MADGGEHIQQKGAPKTLRFVTNYGAPHPKRRRIGAACLTCRKRKTACSGEKPYCETCKQNKLECVGYSADAPTPAPNHRRTTSDAVFRKVPQAEGVTKSRSGSLNWPSPPVFAKRERGAREELPHTQPGRANGYAPAATRPTFSASTSRERGVQPLFAGSRNRMPYFRWLGPTAIMPGFKQMVVKVNTQEPEMNRSLSDGASTLSPSMNNLTGEQGMSSLYSDTPAAPEPDVRTPLNLPFYDTSPMPPSELITHLGNTFFTHLGCNYPFLQRERFLRDLEEKQVDAILVDAVCALAARFSTHPLLQQQPHDEIKATPAEYGRAFAQRAKTALLDTFACPSVAAVQAALLLAYNEFGESRDSGLWMYLGIAIRMAQDLGMHKLEGLKYRGITGPTPKMIKRASIAGVESVSPTLDPTLESAEHIIKVEDSRQGEKEVDEQKSVEQERVDTFWAVFFLDRVVSSGTGRRSTLRDNDIELSFPDLDERDPSSGWPAVFPALIRIVHLYGRVADLLNSVKEPSDITSETTQRLASTESQVTQFYQGLSQRLHFDAVNFQHYMKAGEGTNFVLLHFWFHTMIVLLHQPTLLKTFEGRMLQLFPNSQQLSLSSAKTIADILSYSQLMDAKASLGNPFTTQPIYIAACAFLRETAEQTATSNAQSRANSPARKDASSDSGPSRNGTPPGLKRDPASSTSNGRGAPMAQKVLGKHTLLATAANQHYQLCYKALQSIETYWAGTKYILTVLDQKFEGVGDPLLYTVEEGESSMERPRPEPSFTSPGWRRKLSWGPYLNTNPFLKPPSLSQVPGSPDPGKAIGWTLTGTMDSPNTNLAWHYSSRGNNAPQGGSALPASPNRLHRDAPIPRHNGSFDQPLPVVPTRDAFARPILPLVQRQQSSISTADADLLLGLGSPYRSGHGTPTGASSLAFTPNLVASNGESAAHQAPNMAFGLYPSVGHYGDMMIESQDVDMSMLGLDMNMPWFDAFPPLHEGSGMYFDDGGEIDAHGGAAAERETRGQP